MSQLSDLILKLPSAFLATTIALAITFLPGLAILNGFRAFRHIDWLSRLCIAPGVSVAFYVVMLEVCYVLHIQLGWWTPWLIAALATAWLLYRPPGLPRAEWQADKLAYIAFTLVAAALLTTRLAAIQGLVAPLFGDSVHHTIITQLILNNGGLFSSWQPYDDATTFTYHYGFHAFAAMYAWMRGTSAEFAVLMVGQIANFAVILGLYALVRQWTRSPWGGIFAMVVGGFVSSYPYAFLFWGRYTQLTGQVILIAALVLLSHVLRQPRKRSNMAQYPTVALVIAGLGMAQYKVAVLFIMICIALVLHHTAAWYWKRRNLGEAVRATIGRTAAIAVLAVFIGLPRMAVIFQSNLGADVQRIVSTDLPPTSASAQPSTSPNIASVSQSGLDGDSLWIWWVAVAGVVVALVWRRESLWLPAGVILCLLATYPNLFGIHRTGLVDEFHLTLTFYIVVAGLAGLAFGMLTEALVNRHEYIRLLTLACIVLVGVWGISRLPPVPVDSVYVLPDDVKLLQWIRQNIPTQEKIAGLSYVALNTYTVGQDAAWWIPFYTQHQTNIMLMAAAQEKTSATRTSSSELALVKELNARDMSQPESAHWLVAQGYRYIYIGAKPLTSGDRQAILKEQLLTNPAMQVAHRVGKAVLLVID